MALRLTAKVLSGRKDLPNTVLSGRKDSGQQRAVTLNDRHGVPALPLVTPYKFTNRPAFGNQARMSLATSP